MKEGRTPIETWSSERNHVETLFRLQNRSYNLENGMGNLHRKQRPRLPLNDEVVTKYVPTKQDQVFLLWSRLHFLLHGRLSGRQYAQGSL